MEEHGAKASNFHHIALYVKDMDASISFYKAAFGLTEYGRWTLGQKKICMLSFGNGVYIELHSCEESQLQDGQIWHISLSPEDINKTYAQAIAAGAKPDRPPFNFCINSEPYKQNVRIAWLYGPEGERIELFSQRSVNN